MGLARGLGAGAAQLALALAAGLIGSGWSRAPWAPALVAAIATSALVVALEAAAQRFADRRAVAQTDRQLAMGTSAGAALALLGGPFELALLGRGHALLFALGLTFALLGAALRASAIATLGGAYVTGAEAPAQLTTRGVYAWMRHPSELGLLLVSVGFALLAPGVASSAGLLLIALTSALRIRREERVLAAAFGSLHTSYAGRVSAFVPCAPG